jgi:hypothetical protein
MESQLPAASAILHKQLLLFFQQYCVNKRIVKTLQCKIDFAKLQFRLYPIYFIYDFTQRKSGQELSVSQLSREFGCRLACVKATLANGLEEPRVPGRHLAID